MVKPERYKKGKHIYTKWDKHSREVRVVNEKHTEVPKEQTQLNVEIDDALAQGVYCNLAAITHNDNEFVFDFLFVQPQGKKARVRSRVITSPQHAKRFLEALTKNVSAYEDKIRSTS
ncbi:MAG: DUF3467 domain-containing protein [bacterium]